MARKFGRWLARLAFVEELRDDVLVARYARKIAIHRWPGFVCVDGLLGWVDRLIKVSLVGVMLGEDHVITPFSSRSSELAGVRRQLGKCRALPQASNFVTRTSPTELPKYRQQSGRVGFEHVDLDLPTTASHDD